MTEHYYAKHEAKLSSELSDKPVSLKKVSLNILNGWLPKEKIEVSFTTVYHYGMERFRFSSLPEAIKLKFRNLESTPDYLFSDFTQTADGVSVVLDLKEAPAIYSALAGMKIKKYFQGKADVIASGFLSESQLWFRDSNLKHDKLEKYHKFSLLVKFNYVENAPELRVSYNGISYLTCANFQEISKQQDADAFIKAVIYRGMYLRASKLPDDVFYHISETKVLLNRHLAGLLKINYPLPERKDPVEAAYQQIQWLYDSFLAGEEFLQAFPHKKKWKVPGESEINKIILPQNLYCFGQGHEGNDLLKGLKQWGPWSLPVGKIVNLFSIRHKDENGLASVFLEKFLPQNDENDLVRMNYNKKSNFNIQYTNRYDPLPEIEHAIEKLPPIEPGAPYFGIYFSPVGRWETNANRANVYFRIKELLEKRGIACQVIESSKISGSGFQYFIPNIKIAMLAKLGGIPWKVNGMNPNDLVIGFNAVKTKQTGKKYIGSAICFGSDGRLLEFDCFRADETWSLAGLLEKSLTEFISRGGKPDRLCIHFYKQMSRKELEPIEKKLSQFRPFPGIAVVHITQTRSNRLFFFKPDHPQKAVEAGTNVRIAKLDYLMNMNTPGDKTNLLPLRVRLQSTEPDAIITPEYQQYLLAQVFLFSRMHWLSLKQKAIPVTVRYPEMLARLFQYFKGQSLDYYGRNFPWFL